MGSNHAAGLLSLLVGLTMFGAVECHRTAEAAIEPCVVNGDHHTYDSHPSATVAADGTTWIAWHAYYEGSDRVLLRRIDAKGNADRILTVSQEGKVHGPPVVVSDTQQSLWVVWSSKVGEHWQVLARRRSREVWDEAFVVSANTGDAVHPTATSLDEGRLLVAWSANAGGRFRVFSRVYDGDTWDDPAPVSQPDWDAFRCVFAVTGPRAWLFWDAYDGERYAIYGRAIAPDVGLVERVSPAGAHCLMPAALATGSELCVAWLEKTDVMGGLGVISQRHELKMAVRSGNRWNVVLDAKGNSSAAELTQGLMAKIEPKPVATWGYLGRRTLPMLLQQDDDVWLLWERKSDHLGSTYKVTGDLVGRPMRQGRWQRPLILHQGRIDYHLSHPNHATSEQFVFLASQLPRQRRRLYHRLVGRLDRGTEFVQDTWLGWREIDLPVKSELTERREIHVGDRTVRLYWADLHCHSELSADAEGAPDELTFYARDRARLDVVVFTENDFLYDVPLTEYEYELGNLLTRAYSRNGHFLSLPGYEWTSRVPSDPAASLSDRGNWTPPYNRGTHPNHRSVIYPESAGPLLRHAEEGNDIAILNRAVARAGGLTLTQHDIFRPSGHDVEVGMELVSGWGNYIGRRPQSFYGALDGGARFACVANSDTHRRVPGLGGGLTGIYAERLTAEAILDALRHRRCYATSGSRIFLDARANGAMMGQSVRTIENHVSLTLDAVGTRAITSVVLIRDGRELKTFPVPGSREIRIDYEDSGLPPGRHWYLWRVSQQRAAPGLPGNVSVAHGHLAWSSPHWVVVE